MCFDTVIRDRGLELWEGFANVVWISGCGVVLGQGLQVWA